MNNREHGTAVTCNRRVTTSLGYKENSEVGKITCMTCFRKKFKHTWTNFIYFLEFFFFLLRSIFNEEKVNKQGKSIYYSTRSMEDYKWGSQPVFSLYIRIGFCKQTLIDICKSSLPKHASVK